jgi:hypothetical protein
MSKYRKKPVVIEAIRWDGRESSIAKLFLFMGELPHAPDDPHIVTGIGFTPPDGNVYIPTLEGTMTASPGDWIIKGVKGEFYPCKPDIFEATYEAVPEAGEPTR